MRRENSKAGTRGLVLIRSLQSPESYRSTAKLSEPAFELGLSGVVRQAAHMQNLASFTEESAHIGASIEWSSQNIWVVLSRLRFPDETSQHSRQRHCLFHGPSRRCRSQRLKVERQVVLDRSRSLHRLDLECGADVSERAGAKGERLGVMLLPSLVFRPQIESLGVLEVWRKYNSLVSCFAGELNPEIP